MKKLLPYFILIISLSAYAQIPSYYNDVNLNQTNTALKDALAVKISSTHTTNLSYTPGVWDALKQTDLDPNDNTKVLLIYGYSDTDGNYVTDRSRSKDLNGGSAGSQWNREHTYPKSLGNPNLGTSGPGADAHHLRAADISFNGQRSSKKFADGSGNAGDVSGGWYPGDEWKGDVARMMMYTYLRYGNQCLPTNVGIGSTAASDANMLNMFLEWNVEDPVSAFEQQRNPILEGIQGNRNPFIDNPAFATQIWGGPQAEDLFGNPPPVDTEAPTTPTNLIASNTTHNSVNLTWNASSDNIAVTAYDVYSASTKIATVTTTNYVVTGLTASTAYTFSIKAKDAAGNTSASSNTVNIMTNTAPSGGGNATELFISEYVEGSSNNKAIEIANFTGSTIDLSEYSLKKVSNGGGTFSSTLTLSGQLANGDVYVIAHSSATATILNIANLTNSGVMSFNGNDAVGLFKNNILIDLIGNPTSSANFAQNVTLQRKSEIVSPNTNYEVTEWNSLATNTFNDLGNHSIDGGNPPVDATPPSTPTNLNVTNISQTGLDLSWTASTDNVAVSGYDVYQNSTVITTVTTTNYTITNLNAGTAYSFSVKAKDAAGNVSPASTTINITTQSVPANGTASDLLISEYIEGSSNNKALEIANFTGSTLDLSNYSLKKATNGGSFSTTLNLSGQLANGSVFVIANSNATTAILNAAQLTNTTVLSFNGNDAIGLFKNNILIDLIGNPSSSATFAQNVTLRRKTSITSPNTNYTISEWDSLASDTFDGLGDHSIDGGTLPDTTAPTDPTNLSASNITESSASLTWSASTDDTAVSGYDIYNGSTLIGTTTNTNYTVTGLSAVTSYNFTVKAKDEAGNVSNDSNAVSVTTVDTTAPTTPSNLTASNITQTTVDLTWTISTDNVAVTGYEVFNGSTKIATITNATYQVTGLLDNTAYNFSVKAIDAAGNTSTTSSTTSVTTLAIPTNTSTIISQSYFESGLDNWIDGGGDCYRYSGSRSWEGNRSIRIRDNSSTASSLTSESYDLTPYDTVEIEFYFYAYSMENGEDFWVRYNSGSGWQTVKAYVRGTDFENNNFYSSVVTLSKNDYNFVTNGKFRFQADASGNADHIYIDAVTITGKTGSTAARGISTSTTSITFLKSLNTDELNTFEGDFRMFPNPVTKNNVLNIQLQNEDAKNITYKIVSLIGRTVAKGKLTENNININSLKTGVYILEINDGEEVMTQKFVKK